MLNATVVELFAKRHNMPNRFLTNHFTATAHIGLKFWSDISNACSEQTCSNK